MLTFVLYLAEARTSKDKNFELNKKFILDKYGKKTNITQEIKSKLNIFKNSLINNGIEVDNIDNLNLYELKKLLDDNRIEAKRHIHLDRNNTSISKDIDFIKNNDIGKKYLEKGLSTLQAIKQIRTKFIKSIEASDKNLIDIEKRSLKDINDFMTTNNIKLSTRVTRWKIHEKDIAKGIDNLFKVGFFKIKSGNAVKEIKDPKYKVEIVGGSNQSDVKVSHNDKSFFVECKLNLLTSEYFKFGLSIDRNNINYNHKDFIDGDKTDELIATINEIFKKIDLSKFLTDLTKNNELKQNWKLFNNNMQSISNMLKHNDEFKEFAAKNKISNIYPDAFKLLTNVFDLYCKHYIERYNELIDKLFEYITDEDLKEERNLYKIRKHSVDATKSDTFTKLNKLEYTVQDIQLKTKNKIISNQEQFDNLIKEIKKIEAKLTTLLNKLGKDPNNFNGLNDIPKNELLKYFFKLFISSTGRKQQGKNTLLTNSDEEGNMQLLPDIELENSRLGQMITDFYVLKDNCAYVLIADRMFIFNESFNPLAIPNLPVFKDVLTKFSIKMLVSDDLTKISLHIKALEPDNHIITKFNHLSFILKDNNYIIKKLKNGIEIKL